MSSFNNLSGAPLQFNGDFCAEQGVQNLLGSFQGNTTNPPAQAQNRGSWFTVSRVAVGQYRVQVVGMSITNSIVPVQSVGNGQPNGLLAEPTAWVNSEAVATAPSLLACFCSKYDVNTTNPQSFDIFIKTQAGAAADPAVTDRVSFTLSYKVVANLP